MKRITPNEQAILKAAQKALSGNRHATIAEVAKDAGCATSSVYYLAKKLGYDGWSQMSHELRHGHATIAKFGYHVATRNITSRFTSICELLISRKKEPLLIDSLGNGDAAASYLMYKLACRGFQPLFYSMTILENYRTNKRQDKHKGIMFIINESGIALASDCKAGKEAGFNIISFTRTNNSPVALSSDIAINIKDNKSSYRSGYEPNFFGAKVIAFIEILFANYDRIALLRDRPPVEDNKQ